MTFESRKCSTCPRYSRQLLRCLDGKINPRTIKGGVSAAKIMGMNYICIYSPNYQKIKAVILKKP